MLAAISSLHLLSQDLIVSWQLVGLLLLLLLHGLTLQVPVVLRCCLVWLVLFESRWVCHVFRGDKTRIRDIHHHRRHRLLLVHMIRRQSTFSCNPLEFPIQTGLSWHGDPDIAELAAIPCRVMGAITSSLLSEVVPLTRLAWWLLPQCQARKVLWLAQIRCILAWLQLLILIRVIITDPSDELHLLLRCAILRLFGHNHCIDAILLPIRRSLVHRSVPDIDTACRIGRALREVAQSATHYLLFRHRVVDIGKVIAASSPGRASLVQSRLRAYRILKRAVYAKLLVLDVLLHGGWYGNFLFEHGCPYWRCIANSSTLVGMEWVLSLLLHHALVVWKIWIRSDVYISTAWQKLRPGMLLRAHRRIIHCRTNKWLFLLLQQAVFHCEWLWTLWRLNHLFHLILPLIEIVDKLFVAWDNISLRQGILDALHLLLSCWMLFLTFWRLLHILEFAIDDNESRFRVFPIIVVALWIMVEQNCVHLLLSKGILLRELVLKGIQFFFFRLLAFAASVRFARVISLPLLFLQFYHSCGVCIETVSLQIKYIGLHRVKF